MRFDDEPRGEHDVSQPPAPPLVANHYLRSSDALVDPSTVGVPGYLVRINWALTGAFFGALLVAFVIALVVTARFAATIGLGKTLRIGED